MRLAAGVAATVVLLALAIGAALLAADVRAWERTLREDDRMLAAAPDAASWRPGSRLGSLAERVLGLRDDVAARRAIKLFLENVDVPVRLDNAEQVAVARSRAEQALAAVARGSVGARASQAETLLGVLVFTDVPQSTDPFQPTTGADPDQAQASLTDFQDAVRSDPTNAVAKYDLELALRVLLAQGFRIGPGEQSGTGSTGRRGAGGGVAGGGY